MRICLAIAVVIAVAAAPAVFSQPFLEHGDVLVSASTDAGDLGVFSKILVYAPDGRFKGELASTPGIFRETLYRDGAVYVALRTGIHRIDATGQMVRFSDIRSPVWLAPALDGSIVASNGSGELYHVAADGSLRLYRDTQMLNDVLASGIELGADQCTVHYLGGSTLVLWNVCTNPKPVIIGQITEPGTRTALRLLPDGSFLAAYRSDIARLDAMGSVVRTYGIPSHGLALDTDGTSFWAGAGSTLLKVDIATGAILVRVNVPNPAIEYLGVVGEPRASLRGLADIPALSPVTLILLAAALGLVALFKLN